MMKFIFCRRQVCAKSAPSLRQVCLMFAAVSIFSFLSPSLANAQIEPIRCRGKITRHGVTPIVNANVSITPLVNSAGVTASAMTGMITGTDGGYSTIPDAKFAFYRANVTKTATSWRSGISTADVTDVQKHILVPPVALLNGYQRIAADLDRNGFVDNSDKILLTQLVLAVTNNII